MSTHPHPVPSWLEARDGALERLVARARSLEYYGFRDQLLEACAEVLARSGGAAVVFLGRSPENLYDLLSALFSATRRAPQMLLLPFSFRDGTSGITGSLSRSALDGIAAHLQQAGLDPGGILARPGGVVFVDCVCWGTTFGNLDELLSRLAIRSGLDTELVASRVRYLGLTKASLGWTHWRDDEESRGARFFREGRAAVVPVASRLWRHLADLAPKTMDSYTLEQWGQVPRLPALDERCAEAVRLAAELRRFGGSRDVRRGFAGMLTRRAGSERPWLRSVVVSLLKSTQLRKGGVRGRGGAR